MALPMIVVRRPWRTGRLIRRGNRTVSSAGRVRYSVRFRLSRSLSRRRQRLRSSIPASPCHWTCFLQDQSGLGKTGYHGWSLLPGNHSQVTEVFETSQESFSLLMIFCLNLFLDDFVGDGLVMGLSRIF